MTIAIGCDLGGTHFSVAIVQGRTLLAMKGLPVEARPGLETLLPLMEKTVRELLASYALQLSDCTGLVLTPRSLVDFPSARMLSEAGNAVAGEIAGRRIQVWSV